jgi:hypothetical protein
MPRRATCDCGSCRKCKIRAATVAWRARQQEELQLIRVPCDLAEAYADKALGSRWNEYAAAVKVMVAGAGG